MRVGFLRNEVEADLKGTAMYFFIFLEMQFSCCNISFTISESRNMNLSNVSKKDD